jgi:hypothetical protein
MHESSAYQIILDEGEVRGLHYTLFRLGRKRFGEPDEAVRKAIEAMEDLERLRQMSEDLLDVSSWQELLGRAQA